MKFFISLFNFYLNNLTIIKKNLIYFEYNNFNINYIFNFFKLHLNIKLNNTIFSKTVYNFYNNDIFSKKSKILRIMAKKIKLFSFNNFIL